MTVKEMKRMVRAFVFVDVTPGKEKEVMDELLEHDEVVEVHVVSGEHDLLAILQVRREMVAPSAEEVMDFVLHKISDISDLVNTETMVPLLSKTKFEEAHGPIT